MPLPQQLALNLPQHPALGREDFLSGEGNRAAVALIDAWPDWPAATVLLCGPEGSGKSHLVEIWRSRSGAEVIPASLLPAARGENLVEAGAVAVEDIDRAAGHETALFHLLNLARERGASVLLTARDRNAALSLQPADLASRLRAAQPSALLLPDDDLLGRVLVKLFADRQVTVGSDVLAYLTRRIERSFAAAQQVVDRLDRAALASGRPVTRPLAATVLAQLAGAANPGEPAGGDAAF